MSLADRRDDAQQGILCIHKRWHGAAVPLGRSAAGAHCLVTALRHGVRRMVVAYARHGEIEAAALKGMDRDPLFSFGKVKEIPRIAVFENRPSYLREIAKSTELAKPGPRGFSYRPITEKFATAKFAVNVQLHCSLGKMKLGTRADFLIKTAAGRLHEEPRF